MANPFFPSGTIPLADLEAMTQAIQEGCERIDEIW